MKHENVPIYRSACNLSCPVIFALNTFLLFLPPNGPQSLDANSGHDGAAEPATVWEDAEVRQEGPHPVLVLLLLPAEGPGGPLLPGRHLPAGVLQGLPHGGGSLRGGGQEML